ncbi:MAG: glycosyltransferase family 25 protein [Holosporaceae bacterium]|jgi:GR25 family glycosyltransferase involved in LPS biosynthesis|nr:glycosyltransferase family 25 protein [Holosporaceae bacterium]
MTGKITVGSLMLFFFGLSVIFDIFILKILFFSEAILLFICSRIFCKSHNTCCKESSGTVSGKIGAYLINLDRAEERLHFVMPSVAALGFAVERIPAVDGETLSQKEIESIADIELYKFFFKMFPEKGTIGCALSHEKAWRRFLESDNEFAIIFEDDVEFDPEKLRKIAESAIEKKALWDILNFETKHDGHPVCISKNVCGHSIVFYLTNVTHAGCYLINRRAARELTKKFYPIKMPSDHYFTTSWEFDLKFAGIEPRIVSQKFGDSFIKTSPCKKIKIPFILFINAIYQIQRAVLHFTYNFFCLYFPGLK